MIIKNGKRLDGFCVDSLPIGTLQPYLGLKAPNGYLICDGSLISKTVYPDLYTICGSLFGTETDTHFYLPDLRGKTIAGYNADDSTLNTIGKLLGSVSHTHTTGNHTLTIAEMPGHSHAMSHAGNLYFTEGASARWMPGVTDDNIYADGTTDSTGGSQPHNHGDTGANTNYQPTMVANWIVKAKMIAPVTAYVENSLTSTSEINALSAKQGSILNNTISTLKNTVETEVNNIREEMVAKIYDRYIMPTNDFLGDKRIYRCRVVTFDSMNNSTLILPTLIDVNNVEYAWIDPSNSYFISAAGTPNMRSLPINANFYIDNSDTCQISASYDQGNVHIISNSGWGNGWMKAVTVRFTYINDPND